MQPEERKGSVRWHASRRWAQNNVGPFPFTTHDAKHSGCSYAWAPLDLPTNLFYSPAWHMLLSTHNPSLRYSHSSSLFFRIYQWNIQGEAVRLKLLRQAGYFENIFRGLTPRMLLENTRRERKNRSTRNISQTTVFWKTFNRMQLG